MENLFGFSLDVPKVAVANAWVSPLVNKADPWTEGNNQFAQIGLISVVFLPSRRVPKSRLRYELLLYLF
jgi:hypothetical protein